MIGRRVLAAVLASLCGVAVAAADCRHSTDALASMAVAELVLSGPDQRSETLSARIADDHRERGSGFQHICPETVQETAIYFVFPQPRRPSFHMHNVKAPLDIAFVDQDGVIVDIQRMEPYVLGAAEHPRYSPPGRVVGALETRAGYFAQHEISPGSWTIRLAEQ